MPDRRTLLLTGIPRSGTTLCCHLLNGIPNTVALHEPISSEQFAGQTSKVAVQTITAFASSSRGNALSSELVQSKQMNGAVPSNPVADSDTPLRREQVTPGSIAIDKPLAKDFTLVIKHNALFAALLGTLTQQFCCCAIVRNPLATLASWQTVDLPIHTGHIPMGEQFDTKLQTQLNTLETTLDRQIHIMRWFYNSFTTHLANEDILRYEDIVNTNGEALSVLIDKRIEPATRLENQNANKLYQKLDIDMLLNRLLQEADMYQGFYSRRDLEDLADDIRAL